MKGFGLSQEDAKVSKYEDKPTQEHLEYGHYNGVCALNWLLTINCDKTNIHKRG